METEPAEIEWDDEEEDSEHEDFLAIKWVADGAKTLSEAAARLVEFAENLRTLEAEGWQLTEPIENGHGLLHSD